MEGKRYRETLLELIDAQSQHGAVPFQSGNVLPEAAKRLDIVQYSDDDLALLICWNDLFRSGLLGWGSSVHIPNPPHCHVTERGRKTLEHLSRDPANPEGYLSYLYQGGSLNPVARSYVEEALRTYNADCVKAAAVMIGCATESCVLEVRDALVSRMTLLGQTIPGNLNAKHIKQVLQALTNHLESKKANMPSPLEEAFESYWSAFTGQIRAVRNDAGHPSSIAPITTDAVHASLLMFPEIAKLTRDLCDWISHSYS